MGKYIETDKLKQMVEHKMDMQDTYLPAHFFDIVDDMPAADVVEVRHGRWEELMEHRGAGGILGGKDICVGYACSECGEETTETTGWGTKPRYNYCPNCGASMVSEVEE